MILQAGPAFKVLGKNSLDEFTLATPAFACQSLLIRCSIGTGSRGGGLLAVTPRPLGVGWRSLVTVGHQEDPEAVPVVPKPRQAMVTNR